MQQIEDASFAEHINKAKNPVIITFFSEWCTTCAETMPIVEGLAEQLKGKADFYQIDFDENTQSDVNCGVLVVPTIVLFKGGQSAERIVGFQPEKKLRERISPHIDNWD